MKRAIFIALMTACATTVTAAHAACPERVVISGGTATVEAIARACGINAQALKSANPGMIGDTIAAGTTIRVPRPSISMPGFDIGQIQPRITLPSVPSAIGPSGSTVILPPPQPQVPQQHILRGFGDQPGQLPLPPGHTVPGFGKPFPLQHN